MAITNMTTFEAALKILYDGQKLTDIVNNGNPLLAMVPKMTKFMGRKMPLPVEYSHVSNLSSVFGTAQATAGSQKLEEFELVRKKYYNIAQIDGETIRASEGDKGAFVSALKNSVDSALLGLKNVLAQQLYGSGNGQIGQLSATSTLTTDFVLANPYDAIHFPVGRKIEFSADATGGSVVASSDRTVTAANLRTGVITVNATLSGSGVGVSYYVFGEDDYDNVLSGLQAWIPSSDPSATEFFGVNRSVDPAKLAGVRWDGSAQSIEEALIDACAQVSINGGVVDHIFLHPTKWAELAKSLQGRGTYELESVKAPVGTVSFSALKLAHQGGVAKVIADRSCPVSKAFCLQMNTWVLASLGECPGILQHDDNRLLRQSSDDGVEVRLGYYAQLGCRAPAFNATVTLSS